MTTNGTTDRVQVQSMRLENVRGFEAYEITFPPEGVIIEGENGEGKSSLIDGISLCLYGKECDPDDVRRGAPEGKVTLRTSHGLIVRRLSTKGTALGGKTRDGAKPTQDWIANTFGEPALIDPSKLLALDERDIARRVCEVMPSTVTPSLLSRWNVPSDHGVSLAQHGSTVVKSLRDRYYAERADANTITDDRKRSIVQVERQAADVIAMAERLAAETILETAPVPQADQDVRVARRELDRLNDEAAAARKAETASTKTRERIASLRSEAAEDDKMAAERALPPCAIDEQTELVGQCNDRIATLERELAEARRMKAETEAGLRRLENIQKGVDANLASAAALRAEAAGLEAALGSAPIAPPAESVRAAEEALEAAALRLDEARKTHDQRQRLATAQSAADTARKSIETATEAHRVAAERAKALDVLVRTLTDRAPADLAAESGCIPGLVIEGERLVLDGAPWRRTNTAKRAAFAVRLAMLSNPKCGWIAMDNLNHFSLKGQAELLRTIHAAGLTPICGLVTETALVIRPATVPAVASVPEVTP